MADEAIIFTKQILFSHLRSKGYRENPPRLLFFSNVMIFLDGAAVLAHFLMKRTTIAAFEAIITAN